MLFLGYTIVYPKRILLAERFVMILSMDIDGTIRNALDSMARVMAVDYPEQVEKFNEVRDKFYDSPGIAFNNDREKVLSWMYVDRPFEIFGKAERMHKNIMDDLNIFANSAKNHGIEVIIASVQRGKSIPATMYWLAKFGCTISRYVFFDTMEEKVCANFDIYVDDCPHILENFDSSRIIKNVHGYNSHIDCPSIDVIGGKFDDIYEILGVEKIIKKG